MADHPIEELGNRTPLEVATHPNMDLIAARGICGTVLTLPEGAETGTDVAVLSIFGYDPLQIRTTRGPLEAGNMGIYLGPDDIALRCNLISVSDAKILDHSAGHISTQEATGLVQSLKDAFAIAGEIEFYTGVGFRHILVLRGQKYSQEISCTPPHDAIGKNIKEILITPKNEAAKATAELLNRISLESLDLLSKHSINAARITRGLNPGNMMWAWSPGKPPIIPTFTQKYGLSGAVISAVDLVNGIGFFAGMKRIHVPGATGYHDTNYEGKADAALEALKDHDLVVVHVEAPDEASHIGDYKLKVKTIEDLDQRLVGRVLRELKGEYVVGILPDHATLTKIRTHVRDPVPFAFCSMTSSPTSTIMTYSEASARRSSIHLNGDKFMKTFLKME